MFGKKQMTKSPRNRRSRKQKDKAAMEKFGVDFDSYTSEDIKEKECRIS